MTANPEHVDALVDEIKPILAGHAPNLVGAVLADLLAIFMAGLHPALREEILEMHIKSVRGLIPINEARMREEGRYPPDWRPQ